MDQAAKLTPLQIDIVEFLHGKEGELVNWKQMQRRFPAPDENLDCDERLSESVWGLIEQGIVFEPKAKPGNYHLTEQACRAAPGIIAGKGEAIEAENREIRRLEAIGRRGRPVIRPDADDPEEGFTVRNAGLTEHAKTPAPRAEPAERAEPTAKPARKGVKETHDGKGLAPA